RYYCNDNFHVASITYNDSREISGLLITSDKGNGIFEWRAQNRATGMDNATIRHPVKKESAKRSAAKKEYLSKVQMKGLEAELQRTGVLIEAVQQRYHVDDPAQMSEETYNKVMKALSETKTADAA
ncbi:MAG: hypothetical protein K2G55_15770, partial [Lachnospiraceae bacterium]|nr:hypothetical protein [Lachnospiraceae bacterium]